VVLENSVGTFSRLMHDLACSDFHDHEYVQDPERRRQDHEEVTGHDSFHMIADKGGPALLQVRGSLETRSTRQILAHGTRRDSKAKMNAFFFG
jgi:hypothetical protein